MVCGTYCDPNLIVKKDVEFIRRNEVTIYENIIPFRRGRIPICRSCYRSITEKKVPKFGIDNGFDLRRGIPEVISRLSAHEVNIISISLPIIRIDITSDRAQRSCRSFVKHLWNKDCNVVFKLPRTPEEPGIVKIM